MAKKIKALFNRYITLGIDKNTTKNEFKKIKLLNIFCATWQLFILFSFIEDYIKGQLIPMSYICMLFTVFTIQLLQYYRKFNAARILFISGLTITAFVYSNFIYTEELLEYYFLLPFAISLIYIDNRKINIITFIVCLLGLYIPNLYFKHYPISVFNNQNVPFLFFSIYVIINYFKSTNKRNEKVLEERKQELEEINNFQSQFFINISHEIRTPLTILKGEVEQLKDYEENIPDIKTIRHGINTEVNKITNMVNDVLDLSKIETSKFILNTKTINGTELLQNLFLSFETVFKRNNISFNLKPILYNYYINADKIQLERAISNIIVNASKYTNAGGRVTLSIHSEENQIILLIKDNGIGVSKENINKIFKQFYQVKNDINLAGGSGVGLSLTKEIINLHEGKLYVESEINKGTTFKIVLPLESIKPFETPTNEDTKEATLNNNLKRNKIHQETFLIVDDNFKMRQYIAQTLHKQGHNSILVENGVEALHVLEDNNDEISFIVTDYMMPKMNGVNFIKQLKERKIDIPVLMLTARHDNESRLEIFKLGIDDYLTKPFESEEFIIRIQNTLRNYKLRNQYINQENISTEEVQNTETWIDEVETFISENCGTITLNQNEIAKHFNMSRSSLYRKIKTARGMTPNKLITEIKLQKARKIITNNSDVSLKHLALDVGFQHSSYFSEIFYHRFGFRPVKKNKIVK